MNSMNKLGSMVAVAVLGATLGVGSSFGWWQGASSTVTVEDVESQNNRAENSNSVLVVGDIQIETPTAEKKPAAGTTLGIQLDSERDSAPADKQDQSESAQKKNAPQADQIIVKSAGSHDDIEKLIQDLGAEAKEMDAKGQKEAAGTQRRVIERLRAIQKSTSAQAFIVLNHGKGKKSPGSQIQFQSGASVKPWSDDPKQRERNQAEAEIQKLTAHRNELLLKLARADGGPDQLKMQAVITENDARLAQLMSQSKQAADGVKTQSGAGETFNKRIKIAHPSGIDEQLRQIADQLEKSGQKDAAQNIREAADKLQKDKPAKHHAQIEYRKVGEDHGPVVIVTESAKEDPKKLSESAKKGMLYLQRSNSQSDSKYGEPDQDLTRKTAPSNKDAALTIATQEKVIDLLTDLRREMKQLREEVKDLRHEIKMHQPTTAKKKVVQDKQLDDSDAEGDEARQEKKLKKERVKEQDGDDADDDPVREEKDDESRTEKQDGDEQSSTYRADKTFSFYYGLMR